MSSAIERMIVGKLEEDGFVFVSEDILNLEGIFHLAMRRGYGLMFEPMPKRLNDYPMLTKVATSEVIATYVAEKRVDRAHINEARQFLLDLCDVLDLTLPLEIAGDAPKILALILTEVRKQTGKLQ